MESPNFALPRQKRCSGSLQACLLSCHSVHKRAGFSAPTSVWACYTGESFSNVDQLSDLLFLQQKNVIELLLLRKGSSHKLQPWRTMLKRTGLEIGLPERSCSSFMVDISQASRLSFGDTVLMYCKGGGYIFPATKQFDLLWSFKDNLSQDSAMIILQYSVAPDGQYPLQLQQGTELLRYIIQDAGKKASNVIPLLLLPDCSSLTMLIGYYRSRLCRWKSCTRRSFPPSSPTPFRPNP